MSIIYSMICRIDSPSDIVPLCEYDTASGNYPQIIIEMVKQLREDSIKKTYKYNSEYSPSNAGSTSTSSRSTPTSSW